MSEAEESAQFFFHPKSRHGFKSFGSEIINAKALPKDLETIIGLLAESFERCVGDVDGCL